VCSSDLGPRELRQVAVAARQLLAAIKARDAELAEAHRRELEQLNRMAAELAHEIGNPLNAIALTVERVATVEDPGRRRSAVDRVRAQLRELEAIVVRLRDLTRPLAPALEPVDVAELVRALSGAAAVELDLDVPERTIRTDPGLLTQVLRNLVLNAAQAGATRVAVRAEPVAGVLRLEIRDDGPGIPDDQVARIFEWFHSTRASGTGIGLPVSRRIAEALGGTLELVAARPATFHLTLPLEPG
jgi:signal transduction histidine kinase